MLFHVQESEHLCWKSHINENTSLAGAEMHSAEFLGYLTRSRCLFFSLATSFFGKGEKSLQTVPTTPSSPPGIFLPPFPHPPIPPSSLQTFTAESFLCINIKPVIWSGRSKALIVCFQVPCHPLVPLFSVYSRIWVRKYILGRLNPTTFDFCSRSMASSCAPWLICVGSHLQKQGLPLL